jgi:hypothetical protein
MKSALLETLMKAKKISVGWGEFTNPNDVPGLVGVHCVHPNLRKNKENF